MADPSSWPRWYIDPPGDGLPPAGFIDAAWWQVYGAHLRAAELDREAWIDALAMAWRLVRIPESLSARQLEDQEDMIDRAEGRKFHRTRPYGPSVWLRTFSGFLVR